MQLAHLKCSLQWVSLSYRAVRPAPVSFRTLLRTQTSPTPLCGHPSPPAPGSRWSALCVCTSACSGRFMWCSSRSRSAGVWRLPRAVVLPGSPMLRQMLEIHSLLDKGNNSGSLCLLLPNKCPSCDYTASCSFIGWRTLGLPLIEGCCEHSCTSFVGTYAFLFLEYVPKWNCWVISWFTFNPSLYQTFTLVIHILKGVCLPLFSPITAPCKWKVDWLLSECIWIC